MAAARLLSVPPAQESAGSSRWYFTVEACDPTVELDGLTAFGKLRAWLRHIDEMEDQMQLPLYEEDAESQRIRIYPLVRPEPEIDAIVSALIDMGYDMAKDKRNNDRPAA